MMKKGFTIFLSLLMLVSVLHLSLAAHFCCGKEVASNVSLSGKLVTCDMECSEMELTLTGTNLSNHCCDDILTFYIINSNYIPSYSFVTEFHQNIFQVFALRSGLPVCSCADLIPFSTNVSPPGALPSVKVDLSSICVFRI